MSPASGGAGCRAPVPAPQARRAQPSLGERRDRTPRRARPPRASPPGRRGGRSVGGRARPGARPRARRHPPAARTASGCAVQRHERTQPGGARAPSGRERAGRARRCRRRPEPSRCCSGFDDGCLVRRIRVGGRHPAADLTRRGLEREDARPTGRTARIGGEDAERAGACSCRARGRRCSRGSRAPAIASSTRSRVSGRMSGLLVDHARHGLASTPRRARATSRTPTRPGRSLAALAHGASG